MVLFRNYNTINEIIHEVFKNAFLIAYVIKGFYIYLEQQNWFSLKLNYIPLAHKATYISHIRKESIM